MQIFLSYRREDSAAWAGRLHDALAARFGERNIFQDVVAVQPGADFTDAIDRAMSQSGVALVVIGPRWLTVTTTDGTRRIDEPDDSVRTELELALAHEVRMIPVLVGGATMPSAAQLPSELRPLAQRQAVDLRDNSWRQDFDTLVRALRDERRGRPWRVLTAAGFAIVVVAALAVAALRSNGDGDGADDDSSLTGCPGIPTDFTELPLDGVPSVTVDAPAGTWRFDVDTVFYRDGGSGDASVWDVLVSVTARNEGGPPVENDSVFYELVVDGVQVEPWCWSLAWGENPLGPDSSNVGLVGFIVPFDPVTTQLELGIDMGGSPKRVDLSPSQVMS